jgi:hypothetical protein
MKNHRKKLRFPIKLSLKKQRFPIGGINALISICLLKIIIGSVIFILFIQLDAKVWVI